MAGRTAGAQTWNDPRSRALVEGATQRRAQQLADTGLTEYRATAHGYVTFLAQLGEGFLTPPKIIKADELVDEVYWRAPNLSKQIIVGRRDTLLFPTDIAYHADHLGIVQNNFPNFIRIGEGDEVRDVPHPLSAAGLMAYDFALSDSFSIGSGSQRIHVYEIKVRPKDDRQPRVVGAVYLDPASQQVVRMTFSFTRAAFLDKTLEELSVVLENRLVNGRFWLPSRQEIEIVRTGEYLDYPVRGIIRGRWEIGNYEINAEAAVNPSIFPGPEIVQMPPYDIQHYHWTGRILDSLPPDVRAVTEEDVQRVQAEARQLVRAQALSRPQHVTMSARAISDFVRFDRVEGLAAGDGVSKQFGNGFSTTLRARYGLDDHDAKGSAALEWQQSSGFDIRAFGQREFRDLGDEVERSSVVNSLAAQEFASDYTDPYFVRGGGLRFGFPIVAGFSPSFTASYEAQTSLEVHATSVTRTFEPTHPVLDLQGTRLALDADRPASLWVLGTELATHVQLRATFPNQVSDVLLPASQFDSYRASLSADLERPVGDMRFVSRTLFAVATATHGTADLPPQEAVYLGGPISGPGYDYHAFVSNVGFSEHFEWQLPAPFIPFSLGRFGRVPAQGTFAPYVHVIGVGDPAPCAESFVATASVACPVGHRGLFPAVGAGYLLPFDFLRFDVAKGLGTGGRWTFSVDVSREFWSIL